MQQRLSIHALVCKAWAAAAAKVTESIDLTVRVHTPNINGLQPWLNQHAGQLASLCLNQQCYPSLELQLPCADLTQLLTLQLNQVYVKLPPALDPAAEPAAAAGASNASSGAGSSTDAGTKPNTPLLPALQLLELRGCKLDTVADMLQLAYSTALTSLKLQDVDFAASDWRSLFQAGFQDRLNAGMA